jgi:hypothetical protein
MIKNYLKIIFVTTLVVAGYQNSFAGLTVDFEGGLASSGYNDVSIPGTVGTKFSLSEELIADDVEYFRIRLSYQLSEKQQLSFLYAPFEFQSEGFIDRNITFNTVDFPAGTPLYANYRFDSYRLSYQYLLYQSNSVRGKIGFTGKIRDAAISLSDGVTVSEKVNTGFVPLIYFSLDWRLSNRIGLLIEGDALAAPQGRAEDVLASLYTTISNSVRIRGGYRILEGGADNDEVYTFALVNYYSIGLTISF